MPRTSESQMIKEIHEGTELFLAPCYLLWYILCNETKKSLRTSQNKAKKRENGLYQMQEQELLTSAPSLCKKVAIFLVLIDVKDT